MVINEFIVFIYGVMLLAAKRRLMMVECKACLCCLVQAGLSSSLDKQ